MAENEEQVWTGGPSQWTNFKVFLACILILPIPYAIWRWLVTRCIRYELTSQRLRISHGVFTRETDDLELYRIKDMKLEEPFWLRMVGKGNIVMDTSDRSHPVVVLQAIDGAPDVREKLRDYVEALRDTKRVREVDFE